VIRGIVTAVALVAVSGLFGCVLAGVAYLIAVSP